MFGKRIVSNRYYRLEIIGYYCAFHVFFVFSLSLSLSLSLSVLASTIVFPTSRFLSSPLSLSLSLFLSINLSVFFSLPANCELDLP